MNPSGSLLASLVPLPVLSLMLTLEWVGGDESAFGPFPDADTGSVWAYAAVNAVIYLVGLGLVLLGGRIAAKRQAKRTGEVRLDAVAG